jgi:hypothetical protein
MDTIAANPIADPLKDVSAYYEAQIRAEIEREVGVLVDRLKRRYSADYMPVEPIEPDYVEIGYAINLHRGKELFREGDRIGGVPVRIIRYNPRLIAACADKVEFTWEEEVQDEDDVDDDGRLRWVTKTRSDTEDLREEATW